MIKRQLSAIMFTDLAGYTAMMQEDERNAKGLRDRHRTILEKEIEQHEGKILQYYGDGALSVFNSTISAASSAVSIQKASITSKIPLRIGIHTGDVVIEDDGVYGDGVNIASRIESFATTGSVMISDKVFDDLKNHPSFKPSLMGEFELKNVKKPVEVYALTNDGLIVPNRTELKGKIKERIKSVAVLPFINRSSDPENEYFSDGITEELITALARLEGLRVISRTSSFSFKGKSIDIREIGKKLEVQAILEGSVRKSGNRVRISAQLNSTMDGYELWTDTYDRELKDVFDIQDEISFKIAQQLREKFAETEPEVKETNVAVDAYNAYLKGLFYYNKWTPADSKIAVEAFQEAIDIEPNYDLAYSGQALAYSLMSSTGFINPTKGYRRLEEAAQKALRINKQNEVAYLALGFRDFFYSWDFKSSKLTIEKALSLNPKSADANLAMSLNCVVEGDFEGAIACVERAREIDPLSTLITRTLADVYYFMEDYSMALQLYDWLLEQDPDFKAAIEFKAWTFLYMEKYEEALELFNSLGEHAVHSIQPFVQLGYTYALMGDLKKANTYLEKLTQEASENPNRMYAFDFATLHAGLGNLGEAFEYLRKCMDKKIGAVTFLNLSPIWKPLRKDERFKELLDEIGLKEIF